jgi:hypothetical protein
MIDVNGFLCECLPSSPVALAPGQRRQKSGPAKTCDCDQNVRLLISFVPLVYPRCAGVKTLAD